MSSTRKDGNFECTAIIWIFRAITQYIENGENFRCRTAPNQLGVSANPCRQRHSDIVKVEREQ